MSGECTVIPGYTFSTSGAGELVTNPKLNLLAQPIVTVADGSLTSNQIASIDGSVTTVTNLPTSALDAATQSKFGYKNYCYNPAFWHWSGGTSFTSGTTNADGWSHTMPAISYTISRQSIVAGENNTLLLQSKYFWRIVTSGTSGTGASFYSGYIKNPRLFSGQTITISAAVKVSSGTLPTLSFFVEQNFGTGGSPSSNVLTTVAANAQPTSTWTKLYATISVPSITGKTFGSSTDGEIRFGYSLANNSTVYQLDVANVQVETGSTATSFEDINAQTVNATAQIWGNSANEPQRAVQLGSGTSVDSRGLYWKPNVVQTAVTAATANTSSTTWSAITGLNASITPSAATSKVLVQAVVWVGQGNGIPSAFTGFQLYRGATSICTGDASGSRDRVSAWKPEVRSGSDGTITPVTITFIDSPATSSATTYSISWRVGNASYPAYLNRSATNTDTSEYPLCVSTITVTELPQ